MIDLADSDDEPLALTESRVLSMSNITMDAAVLCNGFDSPLVNALRVLANSEKSRAEHAQQSFNYKGGG